MSASEIFNHVMRFHRSEVMDDENVFTLNIDQYPSNKPSTELSAFRRLEPMYFRLDVSRVA